MVYPAGSIDSDHKFKFSKISNNFESKSLNDSDLILTLEIWILNGIRAILFTHYYETF